MYAKCCAVCHGLTGKGDGPVAPAFKHPPTNLSLLAKNNCGKFPTVRVTSTLSLDNANVQARGNIHMPAWNNVFRQMDGGSIPWLRIAVLADYLKTLQAK